ncbi:restriction endonuclease subunit S [Helicobacter pylori]
MFEIERGTRLTKANRIKGTRPLVTAGYENYGVAEYISNHDQKVFKGNTITIDMFANAFYRYSEYSADDNILVLTPKFTMSYRIGLCVTARINAVLKAKFSYGKQYRQKDFNVTIISLPLKPTANTQTLDDIDFHFMKKFIAELEQCRLAELQAYLKATGLSNTTLSNDEENALNLFNGKNSGGGNTPCGLTWQSFKLGDLFEIVGTKSLDSNAIDFTDTGINFVGRTFSNNGIQGKTPPKAFKPNKPFTITATVIGQYKYVKFQTEPYYCSQNINKLTPKIIIHQWNAKIAYYFITHIQKFVSLYDGQQSGYKLDDIKNHIISLPTNQHGKIDFPFMHTLINALMKQTIQGVAQYSSAKIQATKEIISQEMPTQKGSLF